MSQELPQKLSLESGLEIASKSAATVREVIIYTDVELDDSAAYAALMASDAVRSARIVIKGVIINSGNPDLKVTLEEKLKVIKTINEVANQSTIPVKIGCRDIRGVFNDPDILRFIEDHRSCTHLSLGAMIELFTAHQVLLRVS